MRSGCRVHLRFIAVAIEKFMVRRAVLIAFLAAATVGWVGSPCAAQVTYGPGGYGPDVQPLDRILPAVRNGRAGRFFDAEGPFPDADGGYHYRIKWLTPQGRVIWLDADARSGRILGTARSDWREQGPPPVGYYNGYGPPPPPPRFRGAPAGPPSGMGPGGRGPGGGWRGGNRRPGGRGG
jgi:hypothetical protein